MERIAVVDFVHLTITYEEEPNMKVATDIGGTFTDLVAIDENGSLILEKAHTTPPNFDRCYGRSEKKWCRYEKH